MTKRGGTNTKILDFFFFSMGPILPSVAQDHSPTRLSYSPHPTHALVFSEAYGAEQGIPLFKD